MSVRDQVEVAVRDKVNRAIRVPRWRHDARLALARRPAAGAAVWREGVQAWLDRRTDPPLSRAMDVIESERAAMLRDSTSIRDGKTTLTDIASACNKMSSPWQMGSLLYWLVKTAAS